MSGEVAEALELVAKTSPITLHGIRFMLINLAETTVEHGRNTVMSWLHRWRATLDVIAWAPRPPSGNVSRSQSRTWLFFVVVIFWSGTRHSADHEQTERDCARGFASASSYVQQPPQLPAQGFSRTLHG
jgi:hypothetical protein